MSVRDQERREREARRRIDEAMRRADREVKPRMEARARAADRRKEQVRRAIEVGDVQPRPLPGLREDSMASMESMESMKSMASMESMESADYASGVSGEEANAGMMEDMPLPIDPAGAEEDLAQRVTEETGAGGDPHLHAERETEKMAQEMTEDTGAAGDMQTHADRKVDQMANEMFED
jgi:hypothetical protein